MNKPQGDRPLGQDFGWELEQLRQETQPRRAEVSAVLHRLQQPRPRRSWFSILGAPHRGLALGGVGLAALAALWFVAVTPQPPQPQQLELVSAQRINKQVHDDVALDFSGRGQLDAIGKQHTISWQEGLLTVSVTPEQGIQLDVTTPEATVSVVGTVFDVQRDLSGTTVSVTRGKVSVQCGTDEIRLLMPEDGALFCRTTNPAGLATLARQHLEAGDFDGALALSAEGLAVSPEGSYATAELHWNRTVVFSQQSQWSDALISAEALLATQQEAFTVSGHQAAARAGREVGGCPQALPHLQWLAEAQEATPTELAHLADCLAASDPDQADAWLQQAMNLTEDPSLRAQLEQRRSQLEP